MKILSISSLLPIPGVLKSNDFVFQTYLHYLQLFKDDKVTIIRPVKIDFNLFTLLKRKTRLGLIGRNHILKIHGFRVIIFPYLSFWSCRNLHAILTASIFFLNRRKTRDFVLEAGIDIVHAQYIFPDGMLAYMLRKRYKIPYLVTSHHEKYYFDHFLSRFFARKIFLNAYKVVPLNHFNFSYYKKIGITNLELKPIGYNKSFIRNPKKYETGTIRILTVCALIKLKNIDKVILAIKQLSAKYDIHYTIVGDGPEKDNLIQLVTSLEMNDFITFISYVPHDIIPDEMIKHDIFIMPSFFETFGRVYFEAMAMGIPVICAKNSGISGFFKEKEEGISVNHLDIQDIASALEYFIIDPDQRHRIGLNGKKLVEKYTWENVATDLHHEYISGLTT
jgi:glycosyltransferase involved in cell wall biosynthesis